MSLFDLQDVCIAIGSLATLDLPMVVDLIGIYGLKGPYCTLTTTNWFLQALSVIPRGSWGDVARRSYHDPMGKSGIVIPEPQWFCGSHFLVSLLLLCFLPGCEGERRYRTLISPMRRVLATTVHRLDIDASGNPGFTAGHGFNPAGGAPGGG
ncbi:hypothetical protein F511_11908 [Dorcoceras hygrometricum]|uniref:Helicase domain-containing family protein n=2 Tax=Dorcoceras hygrometricum TaxID=472368 RepID=A0A2Z7DKQ3_9LAMI|nr:hypothetical protein F511_11908 [Dorcoceras hygrometricum]